MEENQMSNETETLLLKAVLEQYFQPDKSIVDLLPKNQKQADGTYKKVNLSYVSHSEITKILIEVDPLWSWEPIGWDNGRPSINVVNGNATMWAKMTLLGKTMIGVGTASADKPEVDKELISDFIRNASMRYGIALGLWSKTDRDTPTQPSAPRQQAAQAVEGAFDAAFPNSTPVSAGTPQPMVARLASANAAPKQAAAGNPVSEKQVYLINKLVKDNGITDITLFAGSVVGHPINSVEDLSSREASKVIDSLMNPKPVAEISYPHDEEPF